MKFVFFCLFVGFAPVTLLILGVKEVHIEKLIQCEGVKTDVELAEAILNYQRRIMTVNSQIIVKRPVGAPVSRLFQLILELTKCRMKEEPDTCEFNSRHRVVLDCQQLHDQNKMWSEFVQHITNLSDQCPVSPVSHTSPSFAVTLTSHYLQ
ncbi:hypothetical protein J6590_089033 [Homalodisca vitripennis]|nr:hypothetical protein J6590_089033 [Homalodisca vitripennis]